MSDPWDDLDIIGTSFGPIATEAFIMSECAYCDGKQMAVIAKRDAVHGNGVGIWGASVTRQVWMRCIECRAPHVIYDDRVSPGRSPIGTPRGLPEDVAAVWREVQSNLSSAAHTSAAMMCRKIVFHVAVDAGLPEKNDKDRAPTFQEALNHLEVAGTIAKPMRPWVEQIVEVGNRANHDLAATTAADAERIAKFTHQVLVLHYEMQHTMDAAFAQPETTAEDQEPPNTKRFGFPKL